MLTVIKKVAKSHVLTKQIYEHSRGVHGRGLKVLFPATTRWSSTHITFSRVRKLRLSLAKVCYDNGVGEISSDDFRQIDAVLEITSPFRGFTKKLQQERVPSISLLYSGIHGLLEKLEAFKVHSMLLDGGCGKYPDH